MAAALLRGEIVWLDFTPQVGREQAGRRPVLVVSPDAYNRATGLALSDHVKSVDWQARSAVFICVCPEPTLAKVIRQIQKLL